jgi:UDP-N-acetylmuramate dehydrogenase
MGYRTSCFLGAAVVVAATFRRDPALDRDAERRRYLEAAAWKRATQPLSAASAGCVFKNPPGGRSAGALIDAAGLKGERVGGAMVSPVHANYIVNDGGATFADVETLVGRIRERVAAVAGVLLELEVQVWR